MSDPFILMHISDLHFHRLPRHPAAYASKRAFGALNLVLRRAREFPLSRARALVEKLAASDWNHLLITGDLTQLGTSAEFDLAREVLSPLLAAGPERVTVIPGNHDRYVREARGRGAFEAHFGKFSGGRPLFARSLTDQWWLAAWDSARPAPWNSAAGRVDSETLRATSAWMDGLPEGARVMVANHYPVFFPPERPYRRGHDLINQEEVEAWVLARPVPLYLHGHVHHPWVVTAEGAHGRITAVNSAASTRHGGADGAPAYHRIELRGRAFRIDPQFLE